MWISRVRVTGGFLEGLDVSMHPGLNVVVGPRGAGKTTLLELIRHAVGATNADVRGVQRRDEFIRGALGTGEIILDLENEDSSHRLVVDAAGAGRLQEVATKVLVLGQNELEGIASDAMSRLKLLDLRIGADLPTYMPTDAVVLSERIWDTSHEIEMIDEQLIKMPLLKADREVLVSQEQTLLAGATGDLSAKREELRRLEDAITAISVQRQRLIHARASFATTSSATDQLERALVELAKDLEVLSASDSIGQSAKNAVAAVDRVRDELSAVGRELESSEVELSRGEASLRADAAPTRELLDQMESGLGRITAELRNVDAELASMSELQKGRKRLEIQREALRIQRVADVGEAERAEGAAFELRLSMAKSITAEVATNVVVAVDHYGNTDRFRDFLIASLKGSNTRGAVIDEIANRVLPFQLAGFVENEDSRTLASVAGISVDQAGRVISGLRSKDIVSKLVGVRLSDVVDFRLRDGVEEKSVDRLSTGQKCAVTLPIILSEPSRTLVLDQPEDHLDNAFLVENVVRSMQSRTRRGAQTIVATHNPNIPVLGSANVVVVLESDGRSGVVRASGSFDAPQIVDEITSLMEGGREAFAKRADFYASHGGLG